jgi:hypothetical protein
MGNFSKIKFVPAFLVALLAAGSMWFYVDRILVGYQVADAAAHDHPRGNLSDLYPRWLGARELLLNRRNPYGEEVSAEIEKGYYGRVLDPSRPGEPKDKQSFAYPVYVVFLLAPLVGFSFHATQQFFYWLLLGLTTASVWLWLRALAWRLPLLQLATVLALTLGSAAAVQGFKLQQLSLLVAAMLAASLACIASGFLFLGGGLLALATIKPQLAWLLVMWLLLWAVSDWPKRRTLLAGFFSVMALLLLGAEIVLPGWWRAFAEAIRQYRGYTQNQSVLEVMMAGVVGSIAKASAVHIAGQVLAGICIFLCGLVLWPFRQQSIGTPGFSRALALVLALTLLVEPVAELYNQVLLLPVILVLWRDRVWLVSTFGGFRLLCLCAAGALAWPWIASLSLSGTDLLVSPTLALRGWKWPFFSTFALPTCVFFLIFFCTRLRGKGEVWGGTESTLRGKMDSC